MKMRTANDSTARLHSLAGLLAILLLGLQAIGPIVHLATVHCTCVEHSHEACSGEVPSLHEGHDESAHDCAHHGCACLLCGTMFKTWVGAPSSRAFALAGIDAAHEPSPRPDGIRPRAPAFELPLSRGPPFLLELA